MIVAILQQTSVSCKVEKELNCSPTKSSPFQLLAAIQTVAVLDQSDKVLGYIVNKILSSAELTKGEFVMIFVVKNVHERRKERV